MGGGDLRVERTAQAGPAAQGGRAGLGRGVGAAGRCLRRVGAGAAGVVRRRGAGARPLAGRRATSPCCSRTTARWRRRWPRYRPGSTGSSRSCPRSCTAPSTTPTTPMTLRRSRRCTPCSWAAGPSTWRCASGRPRPGCAWWRRTARPRPPAAASTTGCPSTGSAWRSAPTGGSGSAGPPSSRGTTTTRRSRPRCWSTGGSTPPTPGASTTTGACRCWDVSTTWWSAAGSTCRRPRWRPGCASTPRVAAAEVLGVPDEEWGGRLVAFVVGVTGPVALDELRAWVADAHPRSWAPRQLVDLEALPLLANGKPDRVALRAMAVEAGALRWPYRTSCGSSRYRCAPVSAASPCARVCCCAGPAGGASGRPSWSTTTWWPSPGCAAPRRPPRATGPPRCATRWPST